MKKHADPIRLAEDPAAPEPVVEAILLARSGPGDAALERLSGALGVAAPVAPPAVPPVVELAAAASASGAGVGLVGLTGVVLVGLGAGAVVLSSQRTESAPPAPAIVLPAPARSAPAAMDNPQQAPLEAPVAPAAGPAARRRRAEPPTDVGTAAPTPSAIEPEPAPPALDAASRLREEALLVRNAERLLGSDPAGALRLTEERRRRFSGGALDQEAEVVAIDALLRLGRRDAALSRARAFEAKHPGSLHTRRIRRLIGQDP